MSAGRPALPWRSRRLLVAAVALLACGPAAAARAKRDPAGAAGPAYGRRDDVLRYADEIASQHELPLRWVRRMLAQARFVPAVTRLIMPPPAGVAKDWTAYRNRFVEPGRIRAGVAFAQAHAAWLQRAEERFGVPPPIVLGIVGVETFYGRLMGGYRALDALATLSFDFPKGRSDRSAFFRDELAQLLRWTLRDGLDPLAVKGSYAGAIGLGQFMPGSILRHAVDFDGDGRVDMSGSPADVIGSIAAFLADHGWQRGLATHFDITPPDDADARAGLLQPDIVPTFSVAQMQQAGVVFEPASAPPQDQPLSLVMLENGSAPPHHVAGTANFFALTRYNRSSYYALAVAELGRAVQLAAG